MSEGITEEVPTPGQKPTAEDFLKMEEDFKTLCKNVFASAKGRELLGQLKRVYCDGKLYQTTDRETVYCLAQRDLILELEHNSMQGIHYE